MFFSMDVEVFECEGKIWDVWFDFFYFEEFLINEFCEEDELF